MGAEHVLVIGLGSTGRAVVDLVDRMGGRSFVTDDRALATSGLPASAEAVDAARARELLAEVDVVVPSPGVAREHPLLEAAVASSVAVRSEPDFAAAHLDAPLVAVTGTNGKSTTVSLLADMLEADGRIVFAGGNLGRPLSEAVGGHWDCIVAEISSFQLEWSESLQPSVAALLNVSADHLDRHGDMARYLKTKLGLFANMDDRGRAVFGRDEHWWPEAAASVRARVSTFGEGPVPSGGEGVSVDAERRRLSGSGGYEVRLPAHWPAAPHDFLNAAAACEMARLLEADAGAVESALAAFSPLPNRLCKVRTVAGVAYWNDSKATNVAAALSSLTTFDGDVVLLAGGVSKNADFRALVEETERIKLVVAYGQAAAEIEAAVSASMDVVSAVDLAAAVASAAASVAPGDTVLLAPACASFDEFADYGERGARFVELVEKLEEVR